MQQKINEKIKKIKLIVCNIKIITNNEVFYSENGEEVMKFNTRDGMAVELLKKINIFTIINSSDVSKIIEKRIEKINVEHIILQKNKIENLDFICEKFHVTSNEICYIGDDLDDKSMMEKVGFGVCSQNANISIKKISDYTSVKKNGEGVLREIAEILIQIKGK